MLLLSVARQHLLYYLVSICINSCACVCANMAEALQTSCAQVTQDGDTTLPCPAVHTLSSYSLSESAYVQSPPPSSTSAATLTIDGMMPSASVTETEPLFRHLFKDLDDYSVVYDGLGLSWEKPTLGRTLAPVAAEQGQTFNWASLDLTTSTLVLSRTMSDDRQEYVRIPLDIVPRVDKMTIHAELESCDDEEEVLEKSNVSAGDDEDRNEDMAPRRKRTRV